MVTGAGGFIGSHLVDDQLDRGRHVVATDVDVTALRDHPAGDRLTAIRADLRASDEMRSMLEGVDVVFHLAAAHLDVLKDASYYDEVNVTATRELAAMAAAAGVRRFVHCSSVAVYGPLETLPANEDTRCAPDIVYEKSKLDGESAIRELASRVGLSTVILRPAWVYGPPIYITDVTDAFEKAANCNVSGLPTLNIAGPGSASRQSARTGCRHRQRGRRQQPDADVSKTRGYRRLYSP
jgi:nucleoside-diphosphate-sugar epimerase